MNIGDIVTYDNLKWRIEKFYLRRVRLVCLTHEYVGPLSCPRVTIAPIAEIKLFPDYSVMM